MKRPKFLTSQEIEGAAVRVLGAYRRQSQQPLVPALPMEEIIAMQASLDFRFVVMRERFASDEILGALNVIERIIYVDESLDPDMHPEKEGRYRFTIAHELGHWVLHRQDVASAAQGSLFLEDDGGRILCRASQRYQPREWQANQFAAYVLMPTELLRDEWPRIAGKADPVLLSLREVMNKRWSLGEDYLPAHPLARQMAQRFHVSNQAMQIRLEGMGLMVSASDAPMTL